ncbi:MAG: aspartate aminotransferase family protein [Thermomicrobiales bacterium]|nr:aspartate aminotransferase family protein [Thermomicrobiales bacterium]
MDLLETGTVTASDLVARDAAVIADALRMRYTPLDIASGDGAWLTDAAGNRYLDFGAGWALAGLGYSDRRVQDAVTQQMARSTYAGLISSINQPAVDLAEALIALTPGDFPKKVWFGLAGSDAAETAQRLLMRATGKRRIVSFIGGWHGMTDGTMGLSAHPSLSETPSGGHVTKIPFPNPYHPPFGGDGEHLTDQCLGYLENYLFRTICPPEQVAAVFVEAVQADSGDVMPPADFLPKLRALCDRHGILLVLDEIKIGLGRTGRMFGFDHAGVTPDLVLLGKSLGGGLPLSAIVGRAEILDAGSGISLFTAVGNATCCAAGLAVVRAVQDDDLPAQAARTGAHLLARLTDALAPYDIVGDVRGLGLILGVELVTDRASKEPNQAAAAKIVYRAWELGLILYYAGMWGNVLEITPPLILSEAEADIGVRILAQAVDDVVNGRVPDEAVAAFAGW